MNFLFTRLFGKDMYVRMIAVLFAVASLGFLPSPSNAEEKPDLANYVAAVQVTAMPQEQHGVPGYKILQWIGDNYGSEKWMEKSDFERLFARISEPSGEDSGRIKQEHVDAFVTGVQFADFSQRGMAVNVGTKVGFDVIEKATIAETYAFDADQAKAVAEKRGRARVWELLGFVKQWSEHGMGIEPTKDKGKE